jgi:hypothetical protein
MFSGHLSREIDSVLLTPLGLFVLDFKNFSGAVTPMSSQAWGGLKPDAKNPLEQIFDSIYPVKDLLKRSDKLFDNIKIEGLIVLTGNKVELDWRSSDVRPDKRMHISLLGEVEASVRQIAGATRITPLNSELASKALQALNLKPASFPNGLFGSADWDQPEVGVDATSIAQIARSEQVQRATTSVPEAKPESRSIQVTKVSPPVFSELDLVVNGMMTSENQYRFRRYLQRFESQLLTRKPDLRLSVTELECLKRAKAGFESRQVLAHETKETLEIEFEALASLSSTISKIRDHVSDERALELVKKYVDLLFEEDGGRAINSLAGACRALSQAKDSEEFARLRASWWDLCGRTLAGTLPQELGCAQISLLRKGDRGYFDYRYRKPEKPDMPMWEGPDERSTTIAQELIREEQRPMVFLMDLFVWPSETPWSSRKQAERLVRKVDKICNGDIMKKIRSQLGSIADVLEATIRKDAELETGLLRESLIHEGFSQRGQALHYKNERRGRREKARSSHKSYYADQKPVSPRERLFHSSAVLVVAALLLAFAYYIGPGESEMTNVLYLFGMGVLSLIVGASVVGTLGNVADLIRARD